MASFPYLHRIVDAHKRVIVGQNVQDALLLRFRVWVVDYNFKVLTKQLMLIRARTFQSVPNCNHTWACYYMFHSYLYFWFIFVKKNYIVVHYLCSNAAKP